jgi:hypothetical protein
LPGQERRGEEIMEIIIQGVVQNYESERERERERER